MYYVRINNKILKLSRTHMRAARPFFYGCGRSRSCLWICSVFPNDNVSLPYARAAAALFGVYPIGRAPSREWELACRGFYPAETVKALKSERITLRMPDGVEIETRTVLGESVSRFVAVSDAKRVDKRRLCELLCPPGHMPANRSAAISLGAEISIVSACGGAELTLAHHALSAFSEKVNEKAILSLDAFPVVALKIGRDLFRLYLKAEFV